MAVYEGQGVVAPARVKVTVDDAALRLLNEEAERRANWRGYAGRSDAWGRGFLQGKPVGGIGRVHSSVLPILCGLVGEWAACDYLNRRVGWKEFATDLALRRGGDGGIDLAGKRSCIRIQVKLRQRDKSVSLVRKTRSNGSEVPQNAYVYIFTEWRYGNTCDLLGFVMQDDLLKRSPVEQSHVDTHTNYVVPDEMLQPMSRLVLMVQAAAGLKGGA